MSDRINKSVPIVAKGRTNLGYGCIADRYMMNGCAILVSRDPTGNNGALQWHLSISRKDRDPSWDEIATARYRLMPQCESMAMYLPSLDEYVNLHPFTFHLHEVTS